MTGWPVLFLYFTHVRVCNIRNQLVYRSTGLLFFHINAFLGICKEAEKTQTYDVHDGRGQVAVISRFWLERVSVFSVLGSGWPVDQQTSSFFYIHIRAYRVKKSTGHLVICPPSLAFNFRFAFISSVVLSYTNQPRWVPWWTLFGWKPARCNTLPSCTLLIGFLMALHVTSLELISAKPRTIG